MKCRECSIEKDEKEYYSGRKKCKECIMKNVKKWKLENPESHSQYCRTWRIKNMEYYNEYKREYSKQHYDPEKKREANIKYLNRIKN